MKNKFLIFTLLIISGNLFGQELKVEAPNVVATDESFRVVFSSNGKISDFKWEVPSDFTLVWGPQTGSSTNVSIVNGKRESVHQESYTYILQPKAEGRFTVHGATAKVDKKEVSSGDFAIEVVKAESEPQTGQAGTDDSVVTGTVSSDDIFMRMSVSKNAVTKGEPVNVTLKLYTRADIAGFENIKFPTFNGFWSKEVAAPQNIEFERENVGGKIYNAAVLRKYVLIPQQTGDIVIEPAEMVCQLRVRSSSSGARSIFDDFFDSYQTIRKRVATPSVTIKVNPLPGGAPGSFAGGVGDFKVSAQFAADSIYANEATSFKVTVSGNGNISMLEAPKIVFPPDFEVYDVKTTENVSASGTSGSKIFEWPVIPRSYGEFRVGPLDYSYYDIKAGKYITVTAPAVELKVKRSGDSDAGVSIPGIVRQSVKNIGEDIRFIKTGNAGLRPKGKFFVGSVSFFVSIAVIVVLYFAAAAVLKKIRARRKDVAGTKNRKANKMARMRLRAAADYKQCNIPSAFYEEVHKALLGYISDKLMIPAAELSKENIAERLLAGGVPQKDAEAFNAAVSDCEQARYAPELASKDMESSYNEAIDVISKLENAMKNRKTNRGAAMAVMIILSLSFSLTSNAAESDRLWENASAAYMEQDFELAKELYMQIEDSGMVSADLYYNIGNAFYKSGDLGHSILYYKKALKLEPGHADAANNLSIAQTSALDKIERVPDFILVTWVRKVMYCLSSDMWGYLFVALMFVTAILLLGFRFSGTGRRRKTSFVFACIVFVFAIGALSFSIGERNDALSEDSAVVTVSYSAVKSSPGEAGKSLFILHEGTDVEILDNLGEWSRISLKDGRQGWIESRDIEII